MPYQLRELGIGEVLDQTISLVKNRFGLLLGITGCLYVPTLLLTAVVQLMTAPELPANPTLEDRLAMQSAMTEMMIYSLPLYLLLSLVVVPITYGAIIHAVSMEYLGEPTSVGDALRHGCSRALALIGSMILVYLAIILGLILLIIPGIIFMFWLAFVPQVVLVERRSGIAALKRSRFLARGNILKIFVLGILLAVINGALGAGVGVIPLVYVQVLLNVLLQAVLFVFGTAAFVVLYFSSRCKHEDFDLVRLAAAVAVDHQDAPTAPAPAVR